MVTMVWVDGRN